MHPLDVVRSSLDNWSDAELGALSVGMEMARQACIQDKAEEYSGDDLFDLARLCSFGQSWNEANTAATRYIDSRAEPHRAQAYAMSMNALVHLGGMDLAAQTAHIMLRGLPYDAEVAYALRYMKDALEQAGNPEALQLALDEHPAIVSALRTGVPLQAAQGDAVISLGAVYESAMELAFWQRYAGEDKDAAATAAEVDSALPASAVLTAEDRQRIDAVQMQYRLLGTHLPDVTVLRSLQSPKTKAAMPSAYGRATVFVVFPDWCGHCRKMMTALKAFDIANSTTPIHAYGLVFADKSIADIEGPQAVEASSANLKTLSGLPVFEIAPESVQGLGALDYPLGVAVDETGAVRYVGVLPGDAFNGDGYVAKVLIPMVGKTSAAAH